MFEIKAFYYYRCLCSGLEGNMKSGRQHRVGDWIAPCWKLVSAQR